MTTPSDHQAAAALLNKPSTPSMTCGWRLKAKASSFLDEAISKLHEAQSLMLKARLRDEE